MVIFENISYNLFNKWYKDKKIICFGGGGTLKLFFEIHKNNIFLLNQISFITNNDANLDEHSIRVGEFDYPIISLSNLLKKGIDRNEYVMLLLVSNQNLFPVLEQLDHIKCLDQFICLYGIGALMWENRMFMPSYPPAPLLPKPNKKYQIPPVIHYCWFGDGKMSDLNYQCIASWRRYCPDFKIQFWNEENYDLSKTPHYVQEAYKAKKFAFVSDYVRLDIIYKYGGFYLDTDVELFRGLHQLMHYKEVYAFMEYGEVATGLGFGSVAYSDNVREQREMYEHCLFINEDGSYNMTPCPVYTNYYFRRKGISMHNQLQFVDDVLFLPSSFLCPLTPIKSDDGNYNLTLYALEPNTIAIHKCDNSWKSKKEIQAFSDKKDEYKAINDRLLKDWKKRYLEET